MVLSLITAGISIITPATGDGKRFSLTLKTNYENLARITTTDIIKENLEDVGIGVNIHLVEWSTFVYENLLGQDFDTLICGWVGGIDPDVCHIGFNSEQTGTFEGNVFGYNNSQVDQLLIDARGEANVTKRQELYYKFQEIVSDEAPGDFLVYPQEIIGIYKGWKGFIPGPEPLSYLSWWSIKNVTSNDGSNTLIMSGGSPCNINPVLPVDATEWSVLGPLYPQVVFYDNNMNYYPQVADNWTIGGKYFEFKFNNSWQWTDGQQVTAEDHLFTYQLLKHATDKYSISQSPYSFIAEWIDQAYLVGGNPFWLNVTVDLLQYPDGYVPGFVDLGHYMIPEHIFNTTEHSDYSDLDAVKDNIKVLFGIDDTEINSFPNSYWYWRWIEDSVNRDPQNNGLETPVTSGYWKLDSWDLTTGEVQLVRNDNFPLWWQAKNPTVIDKIIYTKMGTYEESSLKLQAGEIDIAGITPSLAPILEEDPNVQVFIGEQLAMEFMAFNLRRAPFDDMNVRRAICWAIDKQAILDSAYFGYGSIGKGPLYKAFDFWHNPDVEDYYPPNPDLAEEMLDEAGWPRKIDPEFPIVIVFIVFAVISIVVVFLREVLVKHEH